MIVRKIGHRRSRSSDYAELGHFKVLLRRGRQGNIYNARAQLLFYFLNLLFGDAFVAVVVVLCSSSLIKGLCLVSFRIVSIGCLPFVRINRLGRALNNGKGFSKISKPTENEMALHLQFDFP